MNGTRGARLGPALYRCLDGKTDLACIITMVDELNQCCVTTFPPGGAAQHYTRIKFDRNATPQMAKPGTCYCW